MIIFRGFRHIPQGGFEPPQAEPESAVLPLHNRGKLTEAIISYIAIPCQGIADGAIIIENSSLPSSLPYIKVYGIKM